MRARLVTPLVATALAAVSLLALVGGIVLSAFVPAAADSWSSSGGMVVSGAGALIFGLSFTAVGAVVARRQPHNPLGWLLIGVALAINLGTVAPAYAYLDYGVHAGRLPLGPPAVLLSGTWIFAFVLIPLAVLLFPDGQLSARWRWPLRAYAVIAAMLAAAMLKVSIAALRARLPVDDQGNLAGFNHPHGWVGLFTGVALFAGLALALAALARQLHSFRHAGSDRRQQLKWLTSGAVLCVLGAVGAALNPPAIVSNTVVPLAIAMLPINVGVAILRYGLYEIDRIVSRTLAYALLTALLAGTFIGLVALTTDTLAFSSRVGVAASTLAAAALFNPLRTRVQHLVDRRFNRARYDADAMVAAFTARLRDAVEIDAIRADLLDTVNRAVQPKHASIWIRP
jgi:hypothetical protein